MEQDKTWEHDPVWELLRKADAPVASADFTAQVMEKIHAVAWWKKTSLLGTAAGLAAAALLVFTFMQDTQSAAKASALAADKDDAFSELQDVADSEILIAAAENPEHFSDSELVTLVGF